MKQVTLSVPNLPSLKTIGGLLDVVGMAIYFSPKAYPAMGELPHWLVITSVLMIVVGSALASYNVGSAPPATVAQVNKT